MTLLGTITFLTRKAAGIFWSSMDFSRLIFTVRWDDFFDRSLVGSCFLELDELDFEALGPCGKVVCFRGLLLLKT